MSDQEYPPEKLKPFEEEARKCFIKIWISLSLSVAVLVLALIPALIPDGQTVPGWFQRSGSLTTIGAIFISIYTTRMRERLEGKFLSDFYGAEAFRRVKLPFTIATSTALILTIIGTVVWGYGDLLISGALDSLCQAR